MSEEVRLDDNEIRISGAPRTEVTVSGCNARAKNPQYKVIAPSSRDRRLLRGALQGMGIFAHSSPDRNRPN
jgi:hypothetical protein